MKRRGSKNLDPSAADGK